VLTNTAYGKSSVRLVQVTRHGDRHDLVDLTIAIRFEGDYDASYTDGDNRSVLPTDTMKNTVYALAAGNPIASPEAFGLRLAGHFLDRNPRLARVRVALTSHGWNRMGEHGDVGSAFERRGPEARTAAITEERSGTTVEAGIADLIILKSSRSAFDRFLRDEYTTLPETRDRLFATSLTATWRYRSIPEDVNQAWHATRRALLDCFASHQSESVQHTMYAMGRDALAHVPAIESIHLVMPNKHHLPVDLSRFGLENRNEIFVPTDEPHGLIEATISR